ncbi:MAG: DEAD/DEAH box helicase [Cetobacterium sp.]|uniref:DEAD/DEAH box helicase n=1 Tax=unclassified Cetobacterium TaxID=2630983 RepID=UPI00163B6A13|nr:DEAD/DEAH box helicase [Cetobacterium sp. 2A]MBC2855995.1 DEAD/DEAH box helicase family protein [Cetobacterium sp. 2A]
MDKSIKLLEDKIYFMLKMDEKGGYITAVDSSGEATTEIDDNNLDENSKAIFSFIKEIKEDSFFVDWGNVAVKELYIDENKSILNLLKESNNFINEKLEKIIWKTEDNTVTLNISEHVESDKLYTASLILNAKYEKFDILTDEVFYRDGIIYTVEEQEDIIHSINDLVSDFKREELEKFITLAHSYFKNLEIQCLGYKIERGEAKTPVPHIMIEKISQDNSLYLKIGIMVSTIDYEFLKEHSLKSVLTVNHLEKRVTISEVITDALKEVVDEIVKILSKHQRNVKIKAGYYLDEENYLILQEKLAKEFITRELLQLASRYKVIGAEKLRKYNIKAVKPKVIGSFKHSIDFLEGEVQLEIEGEKFSILDVLNSFKKDSYIVLSDGTNALINRKYIEKLERVFKNNDESKVKISFFDLPIIDDLIEDKVLTQELNKSREFFTGINDIKDNPKMIPKINANLREYQEYGYRWLSYLVENNLGGCLADDMGLGKTLQAIALITDLHQVKGRKTLVIMPKSLIYNWEAEIRKFSPGLVSGIYYGNFRNEEVLRNCDVLLTTYGTVRNDIETLRDNHFDLIILDESQNIKNVNAQTTKAVMLLNSKHRIALSGTPIENNLGELYSLFRFLNPSMFGTLEEFNSYYANPIQRDNDPEAIDELKRKIYPFILRRVKKEVLKDLPDKIEKTLFIEMNIEQKRLYEERRSYYYKMINSQIKEQGIGKTQFFILQALNELRQITSCPEVKSNLVTSSKREVLINNICDAVENDHKVLVFTNYISSIENICEDLKKHGIPHLSMTGATKDRQGLVDKFQNEKKYKVFVMTLKTGGVGLNLTAADTIFIYDPWWNKTVENQAVDRAYRLGQDRTVFSYKLILKDTIEEKILKLQESKSQLLDNLIADDGASIKTLTEKDIEFILGE